MILPLLPLISKLIRNRVKLITFPKLQVKLYNKLWDLTIKKFVSMRITELLPIIKCLLFQFGPGSLLAIPTIFWIFKTSEILEGQDTKGHLNMFKALEVDTNNLDFFFTISLIFSILIKIINTLTWLFWLPIKLAVIFYLLDYFNYDISFLYYKLNNLSLGILDWYYNTFIDFLESLRFKYDFYKINHENI